jgi:hypothetical protein
MKTRRVTSRFREILEHLMEKEGTRPGFELAGMSCLSGSLTGYFVNPSDLRYVHIWEVKISPDSQIIYDDTWREVKLMPIDGCRFRRDVILFKETEELEKMGFYIAGLPNNGTLELDDLQWRCLWAVKENLKDHKDAAIFILNPDKCDRETCLEVFNTYMEALQDLQDILGDY